MATTNNIDRVILFEEFRLIERCESEVHGAWKGAHLLLFFLTFVFGSFCTFCFHLLSYMFDEKCVLFPKLISLQSSQHSVVYEFIPHDKLVPLDFLTTQWVEKSVCHLPTFMPLLSGIFGLVWTTMFLMCSSGSRSQTGLQRPWRVLLPVFVFSLAMGSLCIYTSMVTQNGLQDLCLKLSEATGSPTCTYTINVATLAYERRIRGVYQATRLTIYSAWLHTVCWLLSAVLALVRVCLVVDFKLVKIRAELRGNIDAMLQNHERQIRSVSPEPWLERHASPPIFYQNARKATQTSSDPGTNTKYSDDHTSVKEDDSGAIDKLYDSHLLQNYDSTLTIVDIDSIKTFENIPEKHRISLKILYDFLDKLPLPTLTNQEQLLNVVLDKNSPKPEGGVKLQDDNSEEYVSVDLDPGEGTSRRAREVNDNKIDTTSSPRVSFSEKVDLPKQKSESILPVKSNLKHKAIQTEDTNQEGTQKVHHVLISEPKNLSDSDSENNDSTEQESEKKKAQVPKKNKKQE